MKILAIETSCDETSAAVVEGSRGKVRILSNIISSQIDIHKKYGGVVPEVAARNHILNIIPVIDRALKADNAPLTPRNRVRGRPLKRGISEVDLIAVTAGPGLMSSLLIGAQTAETLAYIWKKPLMVINHIEGHIYANWIEQINIKSKVCPEYAEGEKIEFPALCLVVSGGHTQLVLMKDHLKYKTVGQTRDDAAGEAFDKVAKILDLGYPGGPIISEMAGMVSPFEKGGEGDFLNKTKLPRPMIKNDDFDFSFSGLKTAVLYLVRDLKKNGAFMKTPPQPRGGSESFPSSEDGVRGRLCAEFQQAVIDVLVHKTIGAAKKHKVKSILLAGGVAANIELRRQLQEAVERELGERIIFNVPEQILCTDNAAMVGAAAYYRYMVKPSSAKIPPMKIKIDPNWEL
ncbi:MAG: tRNA (adenosine(37)-N6)-threonylcarbamoyltransferase complex transferase subunit TsaD [bacterium]